MTTKSRSADRIAVLHSRCASARQRREIQAFARYCILRVERELGEREAWVVNVAPSRTGFATNVAVRDRGDLVVGQGTGQDGTLATWDAMCRVEQRLRER